MQDETDSIEDAISKPASVYVCFLYIFVFTGLLTGGAFWLFNGKIPALFTFWSLTASVTMAMVVGYNRGVNETVAIYEDED